MTFQDRNPRTAKVLRVAGAHSAVRLRYARRYAVGGLQACALSVSASLSVACQGATPPAGTTRDSAGIRIVETPSAARATAPLWRLTDPPLLEVGAVAGAPAYQFHGIEGTVRLPDGRVVVADAGSSEIRFFDADGRHLASHGRQGEAPGEYRRISALGRGPGDSLWVYDFGLRRFTVLTAAGEAVHTVSVGSVLSAVNGVGRLADGDFIVREEWSSGPRGEASTGLVRYPAAVARLTHHGTALDTVALSLGREIVIMSEDGRGVMSAPLFARHAVAAVHGNHVFVGDQTTFEVRRYGAGGALETIFRLTGLDLALGSDDVRRATDSLLGGAEARLRPALRAHYTALPTPPTRPAYGPLLMSDGGDLWVGASDAIGTPRSWTVFDAAGTLRAIVQLPDRFRPYDIAGDLVTGTWQDELGVEYVRVYRIERPEAARASS